MARILVITFVATFGQVLLCLLVGRFIYIGTKGGES
jgi:hypothetical protein